MQPNLPHLLTTLAPYGKTQNVRRRRPHPQGDTIAYIWIGVFVVAIVGALFLQDNDPNTDEGAGAGALGFIVAGALTAAYVLFAARLNSRNTSVRDYDDDVACADTRSWVRRNLGPLGAGVTGVVVVVVASVLAPSPNARTPPTDPAGDHVRQAHVRDSGAAHANDHAPPANGRPRGDLASVIRAAASAASSDRRISSIACINRVAATDLMPVTCGVTFEGPACQLWLATTIDDPEPVAIGPPVKGKRARVNETTARCE